MPKWLSEPRLINTMFPFEFIHSVNHALIHALKNIFKALNIAAVLNLTAKVLRTWASQSYLEEISDQQHFCTAASFWLVKFAESHCMQSDTPSRGHSLLHMGELRDCLCHLAITQSLALMTTPPPYNHPCPASVSHYIQSQLKTLH